MPSTTAKMLPTRTLKKSSMRERPRRSRYSPWRWKPSGTINAMNGSTLMYCSTGGCPRVIAISPVSKRNRYAMKNATMPSAASATT